MTPAPIEHCKPTAGVETVLADVLKLALLTDVPADQLPPMWPRLRDAIRSLGVCADCGKKRSKGRAVDGRGKRSIGNRPRLARQSRPTESRTVPLSTNGEQGSNLES